VSLGADAGYVNGIYYVFWLLGFAVLSAIEVQFSGPACGVQGAKEKKKNKEEALVSALASITNL
jgi:hypothetical protein